MEAFGPSTLCINAQKDFTNVGDPLVPPIVTSTTFHYEEVGKSPEFDYSRWSNPTRGHLEKTLASLENAKYGLCFSSGTSALNSVALLLKPGDHVIISEDIYGGTNYYWKKYSKSLSIEITFLDTTILKNIENSIQENTQLIWVESLSNPSLKIPDLKAISELLRKRTQKIIFAVDGTFLTPIFQKPLDLGADIVMHSMTKYINGHGDVLMGVLLVNDDTIYGKLKDVQSSVGSIPSPFDCYLSWRSIQTLALRMHAHEKNAMAIAEFLQKHPKIEKVFYPGLKSHPQNHLIGKQIFGTGGMVTFCLKGGKPEVEKFVKNIEVITFGASLGHYNSLVSIPYFVSHSDLSVEEKRHLGISENMIRLSVGIEDLNDLIADLEKSLKEI